MKFIGGQCTIMSKYNGIVVRTSDVIVNQVDIEEHRTKHPYITVTVCDEWGNMLEHIRNKNTRKELLYMDVFSDGMFRRVDLQLPDIFTHYVYDFEKFGVGLEFYIPLNAFYGGK